MLHSMKEYVGWKRKKKKKKTQTQNLFSYWGVQRDRNETLHVYEHKTLIFLCDGMM